VAALEACVGVASRQVFQDVQHILESPISIAGGPRRQSSEITIKPAELDDFYAVDVELHTSDRSAIEMRDMMVWSQLYRTYNGMLSAETAMENSGIENPQQELLKASVNTLFMSPQAQQVRTMMMLKGLQSQAAEVLRSFQEELLQSQARPPQQGAGEMISGTEQISMDEVATPSGMEEELAVNRQVNVVDEMR